MTLFSKARVRAIISFEHHDKIVLPRWPLCANSMHMPTSSGLHDLNIRYSHHVFIDSGRAGDQNLEFTIQFLTRVV
jgi:hypothetical protein